MVVGFLGLVLGGLAAATGARLQVVKEAGTRGWWRDQRKGLGLRGLCAHRLAHWEPKTWACACFLNSQPSSAADPGLQNELGEPASLLSLTLGSTVSVVDSEELDSVGDSVGWT